MCFLDQKWILSALFSCHPVCRQQSSWVSSSAWGCGQLDLVKQVFLKQVNCGQLVARFSLLLMDFLDTQFMPKGNQHQFTTIYKWFKFKVIRNGDRSLEEMLGNFSFFVFCSFHLIPSLSLKKMRMLCF